MSNKYLHMSSTAFIIGVLLCISSYNAKAQVIGNNVTIEKDLLFQGGDFQWSVDGHYYQPGSAFKVTSFIKTKNSVFYSEESGKSMVLGITFRTYMSSINSFLPDVYTLKDTYTLFISEVNSLLGLYQGNFILYYRLIDPLSQYAWYAGTYRNTIMFKMEVRIGLAQRITPAEYLMSITVPEIVDIYPEFSGVELKINSLDLFRNGIIYTTTNRKMLHTLPAEIKLQTEGSNFKFSNGTTGLPVEPRTKVSKVRYRIGNQSIFLSKSAQSVFKIETVPVGNKTDINREVFTISADDLKDHFLNKGTYTTRLVYTANTNNLTGAGDVFRFPLKIVVSDIGQLSSANKSVNISLKTSSDYNNGVFIDMKDHLVVTRTMPYSISVRSTKNNFSTTGSSETIPLSALQIGPADGRTDMQTITLKRTNQKLISSNVARIDEKYSVRYAIPSRESRKLIGKPRGKYSTEILYSITAL